jgi:hypothetical protein
MLSFLINKRDRYLIVEVISSITFLVMAVFIWISGLQSPDHQPPPFWIFLLSITGLLQGSSLMFNKKLLFLRIFMAWIVGTAFLWIAYFNIYTILVVPMLMLGVVNFVSFIDLCNRVNFNQESDHDSQA